VSYTAASRVLWFVSKTAAKLEPAQRLDARRADMSSPSCTFVRQLSQRNKCVLQDTFDCKHDETIGAGSFKR
jgi:hypothetical protein